MKKVAQKTNHCFQRLVNNNVKAFSISKFVNRNLKLETLLEEIAFLKSDLSQVKTNLASISSELQSIKERSVIGQLGVTFEKMIAMHVMGYASQSEKFYYFKFSDLKGKLSPLQQLKWKTIQSTVGLNPKNIGRALSKIKQHRLGDAHRSNTGGSTNSISETDMRYLLVRHGSSIDPYTQKRMEEMIATIKLLNNGKFELIN